MSIIESSGNVFADLGLPDPEERQAKAEVAIIIADLVAQNGWTQDQAAELMHMSQSDVCNIINGRLKNFSLERLFRCLNAIDQDIEITVRPKSEDRGRVTVAFR